MTLSSVTSELSGIADWVNRDVGVVQVRMKFLSMNKFEKEFNVSFRPRLTLSNVASALDDIDREPYPRTDLNKNKHRLIGLCKTIYKSEKKFNQSNYKTPEQRRIRYCSKEFAKLLDLNFHIKLSDISELIRLQIDPIRYLTGSFIVVFYEILQ